MAATDPLRHKLVTLIGGSGFIGRHVAQDLLRRGARVRIAARHPETAHQLKALANLGQLQFATCNLRNPRSIAACVAGADAVVYLVGTFGKDQHLAQALGAGRAAKAARDAGAQAFAYVSAIGADPAHKAGYFRTKGDGEQMVLDAFPGATILRPSAVFGEEGGFVPLFAEIVQKLPLVPLFAPEARLQPVFVDDLARAIGIALGQPARFGGKIFEAAGPDVFTMQELHRLIAAAQQREKTFVPVPDPLARAIAALPLTPINAEQLALLKIPNIATPGVPGLGALGVEVQPLGLFLDRWMVRFRRHGRFGPAGAAA